MAALALLAGACSRQETTAPVSATDSGPRPGGRLVAALRGEPRTLNPVTAVDRPSLFVVHRLMADLLHIDRQTQESREIHDQAQRDRVRCCGGQHGTQQPQSRDQNHVQHNVQN